MPQLPLKKSYQSHGCRSWENSRGKGGEIAEPQPSSQGSGGGGDDGGGDYYYGGGKYPRTLHFPQVRNLVRTSAMSSMTLMQM